MRRAPTATPYGICLVDLELLNRVGFTDHAIERFATRAGLATGSRHIVEPIIRDLLLQEGLVVAKRPHWARSHNTADLYLQLGEWMLFIGRREPESHYAIVTVVNGPEDTTWREALRRGYIFTPPPSLILDARWGGPSLLMSAILALRDSRAGPGPESLFSAIRREHGARREHAEAAYERALAAALGQTDRRREKARRRARQRHLARYGLR